MEILSAFADASTSKKEYLQDGGCPNSMPGHVKPSISCITQFFYHHNTWD